jgi:hypothetical protein
MFKFIAYLPTYLNQLWHNVWYIGLISVYSVACYKMIEMLITKL